MIIPHIITAAALALPIATQTQTVEPIRINPGEGMNCQYYARPNTAHSYSITATDEVTGQVLFHLNKGDMVPEAVCVIAPGGHRLVYTTTTDMP